MNATFHAYLHPLRDTVILTVVGEEYKFWRSSLCDFRLNVASSFYLIPLFSSANILRTPQISLFLL